MLFHALIQIMAGYTMLRKDIPTPKCWDEDLTNIEQIEAFKKVKEIAKFTRLNDSWYVYRPVCKSSFPEPGLAHHLRNENEYNGTDASMFEENPGFDMYVFMWRWVNGLCPKCGSLIQWVEGDKSITQECTNYNHVNGCNFVDDVELRGTHNYYYYGEL